MRTTLMILGLLIAGVTLGQEPINVTQEDDILGGLDIPAITPTPTEGMWYYAQELKRYHSPREMVRQNAEFRANERRARIAMFKWLGFDRSRPYMSTKAFAPIVLPVTRVMATDSFRWIGTGRPALISQREGNTVVR